jgi:DNA-binding MarR family transcriptional regulator
MSMPAADSRPPELEEIQPTLGPGQDSELTWLLHRAAQRMRSVSGGAAEANGLSLRQHILLSALHLSPGMSQVELGRAVGMDKTTLTGEIDRLESSGLVQRNIDPRDRRARTLTNTRRGENLRRKISTAATRAESDALSAFDAREVEQLRRMLFDLIGANQDPGTCL